jgi:predicted DNA-binding protein
MKRRHAFTLRFDPELYGRIELACERKGHSVTAFVQEAVAGKLAEEDAALLFEAFTLLGEDAREASIQFARDAQREVVLKGE